MMATNADGSTGARKPRVVIIGAGPAGLTAARELSRHKDLEIVILEATTYTGGISRTVNYKGNRIDIGGHRFFSKSERVLDWWLNILPLQGDPEPDPEKQDRVMLRRQRTSRIYFGRKFFDYPVSLSGQTLRNLGMKRVVRIFFSYMRVRLFPVRNEKSLEDFFINRFGRELYKTFFRDYTYKVWGVPCTEIKPEWGAQRVKGLSIGRAIQQMLRSFFVSDASIAQKNTETSLIRQFLYPKFGPGQMWETVAEIVTASGVQLCHEQTVTKIEMQGNRVVAVSAVNGSGDISTYPADHVISTMPVKDLIFAMGSNVPSHIVEIADGLMYRDFITVGLLLKKLSIPDGGTVKKSDQRIPDNWIYMQEPDMKVGRMQVFNNWSPYLVKDPGTIWIGLEYFCSEGDELWIMNDNELAALAVKELADAGFVNSPDVLDHTVIRVPKAYPAYFGTYDQFDELRAFTDKIPNLWLAGRNGMHRYNNQDHSMLTAMVAVENILAGRTDKENLWSVNTEKDYHET